MQFPILEKININPLKQIPIVYFLLTVVTLAVYWQVSQYNFVRFDDYYYVVENRHILSGFTLDGINRAFSTVDVDYLWHPLIWLSFMLDYQIFGLNPGGYHLTNVILHILSTLLLFWLFNRMTGSVWKSAFVAGFFALHPLHVESVAWIAERKDTLSAFFWMLTLCLYVYYTEKPVIGRYILILVSFVCALMSKPMVVTLPVIMILLDYWPLGRLQSRKTAANLTNVNPVSSNKKREKKKSKKEELKGNKFPSNDRNLSEAKFAGIIPLWQLREKIPFFILSAVFSVITLLIKDPLRKRFPFSVRIENAPVSFVTYLEKTFWPHDLAVFYPFSDQLPIWQVLGSALLILVVTSAVILMARRLPYLFVGWFWYAMTILPVIGFFPSGKHAMADRYHYLPSIGISIMLAWGIPFLFKREDTRKKILLPAGIAVLTILAILTWHQCGYWKNSITLFEHTLQVTKNNYLAHLNLGVALFDEGKMEEAIDHYNESIRLKPDNARAYYSRGLAYITTGQNEYALDDYNKALFYQPDYAGAYNNRAFVYLNLRNLKAGCSDAQKACELGDCKLFKAAKDKGDCS